MTPLIREARAGDVEPVLELWKAADATQSATDGPEALTHLLGLDHVAFLVAEHDGALIGSVIGTFDGWRGNIYRLAVHPAHRRLGVARSLVAAVDERFARWGVRRVSALVEKAHADAVAFWDSSPYAHDQRIIRYVRTLPAP